MRFWLFRSTDIGDVYRGQVAIREVARRQAANGDYLQLVLSNGEEDFTAKYWQYPYPGTPQLDITYQVVGQVSEYRGTKELHLKRLIPLEESDLSRFRRTSKHSPSDMYETLLHIIRGIQDTDMREALINLIEADKPKILTCPAAKSNHHAYVGGWLEHTLEVIDYSLVSSEGDKDILIAGALLHDIGKLKSYEWKGIAIEETNAGQLLGHIGIGLNVWLQLASYGNISDKLTLGVGHVIIAHHGNKEWGSPEVPKTLEAAIVHQADMLSSRTGMFKEAIEKSDGEWTERVYPLGTKVYTGKRGE